MKQKGTVIEAQGEFATVEVMQTSACVGCSKQEGCIACKKKIRAKAYNPIGADKGDVVTLESNSNMVLLYALLVFILPIVLCGIGYYVSLAAGAVPYIRFIVSGCIFIATYVIIYFVAEKNPNTLKTVRITEVEKD